MDSLPLEKLFDIKPLPDELYAFGARAIVHTPKDIHRNKIEEQATEYLILGYPKAGSGWLFYSQMQKRIIHTSDAVFPDYQALEVKKPLPVPIIEAEVTEPLLKSELTDVVKNVSEMEMFIQQMKLDRRGTYQRDQR